MAHDIRVREIPEVLFAPEYTLEIFREALLTCLDDTVPIFNLEHSLSEV